jgi:hypothetical protein
MADRAIQCPSRNGRFCPKTRPHKGFYRRRSGATSRIEACGERGIGAKDAIPGWTLFDKTVLNSKAGQIGTVSEMKLFEHSRPVSIDRLYAET